jgi:pimeloyl-ACP methyl ester carboxylesterase
MCDQLSITRAVFIGESTGSMLQLSLALERPYLVAASVLAGGTYYWPPEMRASLSSQRPRSSSSKLVPRFQDVRGVLRHDFVAGAIEFRAQLGSGCCMARPQPTVRKKVLDGSVPCDWEKNGVNESPMLDSPS